MTTKPNELNLSYLGVFGVFGVRSARVFAGEIQNKAAVAVKVKLEQVATAAVPPYACNVSSGHRQNSLRL